MIQEYLTSVLRSYTVVNSTAITMLTMQNHMMHKKSPMAFATVTSSRCELMDKKKYREHRKEYKMLIYCYTVLLLLS